MPADENSSADPGADNTPDETPDQGSRSGAPGNDGTEEAGGPDGPGGRPGDRADSSPGAEGTGAGRTTSSDTKDDDDDVMALVAATAPQGRAEDEGDTADESTTSPADGGSDAGGEDSTAANGGSGNPGSGDGDGDRGAADASAGPARGKRRRVRRIMTWSAVALVLVLGAGAATAYGYYHSLRSGMVQHDIDAVLPEEDRPDRISDAVNILFLGTDGYEEGSTAYTQEFEGERSDSIMLAHVSPDKRVTVISFPRDSLVNLPQCDAYGRTEGTSGYFGMINAAMYHGGPPCVVRTVESLTDIRIDHFVHLSFMSFRDVVDAIGGVEICIPQPMQDSRSKLDLEAGRQTLDGDEALSFVRARYEIGNGSDIGRIDRQQMFLAALADQVTGNEVMSSPTKLNGILRAVAQHSATDEALTLDRMISLAVTLVDVDLSDINFHTVPWYQAPSDPNRIMWQEDEAEKLFTAVREDKPLPALLADDAPAPQEPPGASPTPMDEPSASGTPSSEELTSDLPGEGRDATSDPCSDGLGFGTGEDS